ncbi:MAG: PAS domain S-box protein [Kiritimatiellales bacterium]|nr:PAS domain S-box protein [Kiritimatiellales bacterium]MCF7863470.1 PAS domain S-box protein [Kiritimatiellales bacterium]
MIRSRLWLPMLSIGAIVPRSVFAASDGDGYFSYLGTDAIIISILISNTVLLLGFLFRLQQMRTMLTTKTIALEKSEQHLRLMGDNLPNVTIFQLVCPPDHAFAFRFLSRGYESALGINRDQVMADAKLAFDHVYEADIPALQEAFRKSVESLAPVHLEIRVLDAVGTLKWLRISAVPHHEKDTLVWDGFMQDASDSKKIEETLVEQKRNLQNLFKTIDDFLLICDMNGKLLHTNPSVERRLGYSIGELRSMSLFELYPETFRAEAYQVVARMQSEQSCSCGFPLKMKNGTAIPIEMNLFQGSWKNKKAIFGVARDIAGRQKTETALRESQQMLQLIMNTIPMSVFWKDKDSVYLGCNKAFIKECGLSKVEDVIGRTPYDLFDNETATSLITRDQQVISTARPLVNVLYSHSRADGSVGWRETSKIPLTDENGRAVGVLGVWRDVTEQKRAEERLKRTLEDMERFNQLMRGRERRTLELKGEINHLLQELDQPIKYRTTTDDQP